MTSTILNASDDKQQNTNNPLHLDLHLDSQYNNDQFPYADISLQEHLQKQQQEFQHVRKTKECTQFGVAWSPSSPNETSDDEGEEGRYLFSCLDSGMIVCWDVLGEDVGSESVDVVDANDDEMDLDKRKTKEQSNNEKEGMSFLGSNSYPLLKIQASHNVLYNINFYQMSSSKQWFLSVCGDDGVSLYKWMDIHSMISLHSKQQGDRKAYPKIKSVPIVEIKPFSKYHTHPTISFPYSNPRFVYQNQHPPLTGAEVNSTSLDTSRNVLFGAAGDLWGCYQWDLETGNLIGTLNHYPSSSERSHTKYSSTNGLGHTDFLHSVCIVPGGGGHVLTGGEDGKIGMWDAKQNKLIDMIHCGDFLEPKRTSSNRNNIRTTKRNGWVSGITVEKDATMAAFGGGLTENQSSYYQNQDGNSGGFVALWHLSTRSILSSHTTREQVQSIQFHSKCDSLITVGNENVVSHWSWSAQDRKERVWCSPKSSFGLSVNEKNGMFAVCGVGDVLDCFSSNGLRCLSLVYL